MTDEQKQTRLDSFTAMLPQLEENLKSANDINSGVLSGVLKSDNPVHFAGSMLLAGGKADDAWDELERVKAVISYIQKTPADQLTDLSIGTVYQMPQLKRD